MKIDISRDIEIEEQGKNMTANFCNKSWLSQLIYVDF